MPGQPEQIEQIEQIEHDILEVLKKYPRIAISRHIRPDGDAVGSSFALKRIINLTWPEKEVFVINSDYSENLGFLGSEDSQLTSWENTLSVILDTGDSKRISNPDFNKADYVLKIDHHPDTEQYADLQWIEEDRSSVCEMITRLWADNRNTLAIDSFAATCLYAGISTDSGQFMYSCTSPETLKLASLLLEQGVDAQKLFARLYLTDFGFLKFQAEALNRIQLTPHKVAWLLITQEMKSRYNLSDENCSAAIDFMNSIKGSPVWILFIEKDSIIRVRLRSRFIPLNKLAAKYNGGGHENACGATLKSREELNMLLADADKLLESCTLESCTTASF